MNSYNFLGKWKAGKPCLQLLAFLLVSVPLTSIPLVNGETAKPIKKIFMPAPPPPPKEIPRKTATFTDSKIHKVFITTKDSKSPWFRELKKIVKRAIQYKNRVLIEISDNDLKKLPKAIKDKLTINDKLNKIFLHGITLDTTKDSKYTHLRDNDSKQLYLIQFPGPIKQEWSSALSSLKDISVVSYIPENTYLIYAAPPALVKLKNNTVIGNVLQWIGSYLPEFKLHNRIKKNTDEVIPVTIKLARANTNKNTIKFIKKITGNLISKPWIVGNFLYVRVNATNSLLKEIIQQPDVIFVQRYTRGQEAGENQSLILIDQLSSVTCTEIDPFPTTVPNGATRNCFGAGLPGAGSNLSYLEWFNSKFDLAHLPPLHLQFLDPIDIADSGTDTGIINATSGIASNTQHRDFLHEADTTVAVATPTTPATPLQRLIAAQSFNYNAATMMIDQVDTTSDTTASLYENVSPTGAHGTLVSSIAAGYNNGAVVPGAATANSLDQDNDGFHYGMGISPYSRIIASRIFGPPTTTGYSMIATIGDELETAYELGARISNHSWGNSSETRIGSPNTVFITAEAGYNADSATIDSRIRDAQPGVAGNQELTVVAAAGNSFYPSLDAGVSYQYDGAGSCTAPNATTGGYCFPLWNGPAISKNAIVVSASEKRDLTPDKSVVPGGCRLDYVSDSAHDWASISTIGPTADGRFKPDLVAPGVKITGAAPLQMTYQTGLPSYQSPTYSDCPDLYHPETSTQQLLYFRRWGTSFAAPAVSGAAALLRQTFINRTVDDPADLTDQFEYTSLLPPSPAMIKAWLMNTTTYMTGNMYRGTIGIEDLPSSRQGMGLLNIDRALDDTHRIIRDQTSALSMGGTFQVNGLLADAGRDLRVTLVWTDLPGSTASAIDAIKLVNNLNLEVIVCDPDPAPPMPPVPCNAGAASAMVYAGNNFTADVSQTGGSVDILNNVESVWLPSDSSARPNNSKIVVNITGANIPAGTQDFAVVIYNADIPGQDDPASAALTIAEDTTSPNLWNDLLTNDIAAFTSTSDSLQIIAASISGSTDTVNLNTTGSSITITADDPVHDALATMVDTNTITLNYTVTDGFGATGTASATITITGINDPPDAANDGSLATPLNVAESVAEGAGFIISVLSNDMDADSGDAPDPTTVTITSPASFGTATANADGTVTYTSTPDYVGPDQFNYRVNDSTGAPSNEATVFIDVTPSNDSPEITAPSGTLFQLQNTTMNFSPGNTISVDDVDVDGVTGTFDVTISVPAPGNGTFNATGATAGNGTNSISFSGNLNTVNAAIATLSYTGNPGTTGTETVTININDNGNTGATDEPNTAIATFDITLTTNAPPMLELDSDNDNRPAADNVNFENTFDLGTGNPVEIAEGTSIMDADTASPASATVVLSNLLDSGAETLTISGTVSGTTGNIDYNYTTDAVSGTMALTPNSGASPTTAEYAAAIDLVRYDNSATSPDTTNRVITVSVSDGISTGNATSTIDFQRRPVDIALVLDKSGSMQQLVDGTQRIDLLKDAVQLFLETWDGFDLPEDRLGTVYFGTGITSFPAAFMMEPFAANWPAHNTDIDLQTPAGWTSFGAGLQTAIEGLNTAPGGGLNRKPVVITFTDGQQNGRPMVMRPGTNYPAGGSVPPLSNEPYQILNATVGEMVDDGFSVRTLSGVDEASPPIVLSIASIPMNIHTIGTGVSGSNLETMLAKLATDTEGASFFATPDSFVGVGAMPSPLQDHFMTTLVESLSETSLEMVGRVFSQLPANMKRKSHRFTLNNATQRASFVLSWNKNTNQDMLAFGLKTPQGDFIPAGTSGIDIRSGDFYFIVHLNFPLLSRFGSIAAGGEWEMVLQRKELVVPNITHSLTAITPPTPEAVDYSVWVLEDESDVKDRVKADKRRYNVGEPILLTAKITDVARAAKKLSVSAQVKAPKTGLGNYLAKNYIRDNKTLATRSVISTTALDTPQTVYDKNLFLLLNAEKQPRDLEPLRTSIRLHDDGKNGDKVANDGIFSALYTETNIPGSYHFDIRIQGKLPTNGNISRQSTVSVVTQFDKFDIDKSIIEYSDIDPNSTAKDANKQLLITPVDKFGNLLGPGKSQLVRVNIKGGKLIGQVQDLGNGSYIQYLAVNQLLIEPVITIDTPGLTMVPVDTGSQLTLVEWILIIILAIILLLLLYWLIRLIAKLLNK